MDHPGLDGRRDKSGDILRKHGAAVVRTFRKAYGPEFAPGFSGEATLEAVLDSLDDRSLSQILQDHEAGRLNRKIAVQSVTLRLPLKPRFLTQPSGPRLEP